MNPPTGVPEAISIMYNLRSKQEVKMKCSNCQKELIDRLHEQYRKAENYDGNSSYISGLLDGIDASMIIINEYFKKQEEF